MVVFSNEYCMYNYLVMTFFIETRPINQISFLVMAVGYGFVSGMAFNGDMD